MAAARYIARTHDVAARRVGDELMIMTGRTSSLYSLNETAALLWEAADGITPLDRIVAERICPAFDVDADTALRDAETLADELAEHGILRVAGEPITDAASPVGPP
jgi:hypothetical protein